ncbi:MAG: Na(+)-translocating NADH-quinone reductase subunit B [Deltaproteobacteria bacterium SG8_13]|nr:MAG: Na(+)-translocating NADH-quinone reductase subunit B [Deltaproteobacteria bacterium SG8_13]
MGTIEKLFESWRKHFENGGRFERWYPFFESIESVFFAPARVTENAPNVRDHLDVKRFMMLVIVALLPHYAFGVYNVGHLAHLASGLSTDFGAVVFTGLKTVVPLVVVTYMVGFFWETLFAVVRKHEISEGLFVSCALFPLTLPPTIPLWQAALGISFGIVIGKEIFGGTGRNFLNPALTGRAFLYFAYPAQLSGDAVWTQLLAGRNAPVDAFTSATPLAIAAVTDRLGDAQSALADSGYSITTLLVGTYPGSIGGTSTLLCIVGAVFLIILGIANYRIVVGCVAGLLATGFFLNLVAPEGSLPYLAVNPIYHLLMGGAMFGFAYMATDPVSAAHMPVSKWVFGFLIGALTVLIRVFNPAYPEGVGLAILFMNLFAPLLDHIEIKIRLKKRVPNV